MLDRKRPYAAVFGHEVIRYHQDGIDYDNAGKPVGADIQPVTADGKQEEKMSQSERMKLYWQRKKAAQ